MRELTEQEMAEWTSPINYITMFPVIKPSSKSTKLKVVSNSALVNANNRLSLNDCLSSGPDALQKLLALLIHWRTLDVALITDIVKAYHVIHTRDEELNMRKFLHQESPREEWRTYAHTRAHKNDFQGYSSRTRIGSGEELSSKARCDHG